MMKRIDPIKIAKIIGLFIVCGLSVVFALRARPAKAAQYDMYTGIEGGGCDPYDYTCDPTYVVDVVFDFNLDQSQYNAGQTIVASAEFEYYQCGNGVRAAGGFVLDATIDGSTQNVLNANAIDSYGTQYFTAEPVGGNYMAVVDVALTPPYGSADVVNGEFDVPYKVIAPQAQHVSDNIPTTFNPGQSQSGLNITMQNIGGTSWTYDWSDATPVGTSSGTDCTAVDTDNSPALPAFPAPLNNGSGESCTTQYSVPLSVRLNHSGSFAAGDNIAWSYAQSNVTVTADNDPGDPGGCVYAPGNYDDTCGQDYYYDPGYPGGPYYTVSYDPTINAIAPSGTATFSVGTMTAPSTAGSYSETWTPFYLKSAVWRPFSNIFTDSLSVAGPVGGTVNVSSVNSVTGQPVAGTWSAFGPNGDLCGEHPCSSATQSFNASPGSYSVTPFLAADPAGSYVYKDVSPAPSQSIVNPGDTANFAIEWDPVAVLSVSSPSVTLTSASPSQTISALDAGTAGSSINITGYTLNPSSASSYLTVGLPSGPISSLTGHDASHDWLTPSAYAAGGGPVTVTINPAAAPASCFTGAGCPVTVTLNGTSLPSNPVNAALQTSFNVATTLTAISVAITPTSASLSLGATHQFTATVSNDPSNSGVTWSASAGSVPASSGSGVAVTYTAPNSPPSGGSVTLTATSVADPTKSSSVTITIISPLVIVPNPPGPIPVGVPAPFSCSGGNSSCYTWTSNGVAASGCGASFQQTFNAPGVYPVTCTDSNGTTASTTVIITPDCTLSASPTSITPPEQSTLSWNCVAGTATSCNITDSSGGAVVTNGSTSSTVAVAPSANQTYTLSCTANNGLGSTIPSVSAKVNVQGPNIQETN